MPNKEICKSQQSAQCRSKKIEKDGNRRDAEAEKLKKWQSARRRTKKFGKDSNRQNAEAEKIPATPASPKPFRLFFYTSPVR